MTHPTRKNDGEALKAKTVMGTENIVGCLSDFELLAREVVATVCKEFNAKKFAKLGEPRTWFDLQSAAAYLAVSEQTLSRYVKERTAPASVKIGNGRRFHRRDLDAWIRGGGVFAFKQVGEATNDHQLWRSRVGTSVRAQS